MRKLTANQAFIAILVANLAAGGCLVGYGMYLQSHRPLTPDLLHGFIVNQERTRDHYIYYISKRDDLVQKAFLALDLVVFWISGGVAYLYAKAAQRQKLMGSSS
jgi:hypothetical protein